MNTKFPATALIPAPAPALPAALAAKLEEHAHAARGALAPETERAMRKASAAFTGWAASRALEPPLPATPGTVAAYVDHMAAHGWAPASIRQAAWAIGAMHRAAGVEDPTKAEVVRLALKRMGKALGTRQRQAAPIGEYELRRIMETAGTRLADQRNLALLLTMRDLLARRSEVVALDVADVAYDRDGSATVLIRRSKTDQLAEGAELYLSARAVAALRRWLAAAGISEGAAFRAVNKGGRVGERLQPDQVARIVKRMAERAGLKPEVVARVSGHSCRVGMAQDLVAGGADLAGVMQAGRWKSPMMPARYTARLEAKRGAVAQLYQRQSG